ncbi:hypothetical protein CH373_17530 [Leptospira perolatii]|uniref:Cell surface protein n=1 Tax=Leptospira perolatii TaxID=2023191 RepID=A0A2M9ZIA0_9LEPT|nr:cell surface protein [Leptospira perolatii]PJZ69077.1 hypothetical protein CH360_12375 [Leptospira perolatii]PJZ71786.1 hypothetical protein CH373_17530 [Leptospira perolatii]
MKRLIFTQIIALAISLLQNCTVQKDENYNKNASLLQWLIGTQAHAFVYVANQDASASKINVMQISSSGNPVGFGDISSPALPAWVTATGSGTGHVYASLSGNNSVQVLDYRIGSFPLKSISVGRNPTRIYVDPMHSDHNWVMNDGDGSGADTILCDASHSSFTVIHDTSDTLIISDIHETICIGKGPHNAAFATMNPMLAMVTNETDSSISVVDNDENSPTFLHPTLGVLRTLTLGSNPKGIVYSPSKNRFYSYLPSTGEIAIIDPTGNSNTGSLAGTISGIGSGFSILKIDETGNFLVLSGIDLVSSATSASGILTVVDLSDNSVHPISVPNSGFSDIQFSHDGTKLFVATAENGNATQKASIMTEKFYIYDSSHLPHVSLAKTVQVGHSHQSYRTFTLFNMDNMMAGVYVPNFSDGTVTALDGMNFDPVATINTGGSPLHSTIFCTMNGANSGHDHGH